jgi:hypothetical protein
VNGGTPFLISVLGGSGQLHALVALSPGKKLPVHIPEPSRRFVEEKTVYCR